MQMVAINSYYLDFTVQLARVMSNAEVGQGPIKDIMKVAFGRHLVGGILTWISVYKTLLQLHSRASVGCESYSIECWWCRLFYGIPSQYQFS